MLLLLRAHFSFCQLPLLEITSNLALLCSNSHQTNPNSTPHTLIIMDFNSTTTSSSSMPHNTTESVTFDSVAERSPSSTVQVTGCYSCDVFLSCHYSCSLLRSDNKTFTTTPPD